MKSPCKAALEFIKYKLQGRINVVELKDESMDEDELNSNRRTKDEANSEVMGGGRGRGTN